MKSLLKSDKMAAKEVILYVYISLSVLHSTVCFQKHCIQKTVESAEEEANVILTGTIRDIFDDGAMKKADVEVKRIIKGDNIVSHMPSKDILWPWRSKVVTVEGLYDPVICHSKARKYDTRIFMLNPGTNGYLKLNASLQRMTLNNVIRADAAVHGK